MFSFLRIQNVDTVSFNRRSLLGVVSFRPNMCLLWAFTDCGKQSMPGLFKVLELMISGLYCLWHCRWCLVMDHFKITGYLVNMIISTLSFIVAFCSAPVPKKNGEFLLMAGKALSSGPAVNHLVCKLQFPEKGQWYHSTLMLSYWQKMIAVF